MANESKPLEWVQRATYKFAICVVGEVRLLASMRQRRRQWDGSLTVSRGSEAAKCWRIPYSGPEAAKADLERRVALLVQALEVVNE